MFDYRSSSHHSDDAAQVDELQVAAGAKRSELMGNSELPGDQENSDWSLPIITHQLGMRGNTLNFL
jgi:hypothetical protein